MLKPRLEGLFAEYAESHRTPGNRLTHKIAIPMIVFHIVAMASWIPLFSLPGSRLPVTLAMVGYLAAVAWYLSQDVKLGLILAAAIALCFPLSAYVPRPAVVAIAAVGWLIQLAGHALWEKKSPSFFTNLVHALVGPMFFVAVLLGEWPREQAKAPSSPTA